LFLATVYFLIQVFTIGSKDIPKTSLVLRDNVNLIELNLANETFVKYFIMYFGYGEGKVDVQFYKDNVLISQQTIESVFYQGKVVSVSNMVDKIIMVVNGNNTEIKEISIKASEDKIIDLTNSKISLLKSSNYKGLVTNLIDEQQKMKRILNYRFTTYFDEIYHARTAYELLKGLPPYDLVHPPTGKWLIALGMALFGVNPFGWRIINLIFGSLILFLMSMLLNKIIKQPGSNLGIFASILMATDFLHTSLSRTANLDTFSLFFVLMSVLLGASYIDNLKYRKSALCYLTFVFAGIAFSCKWNSLYTVIPVLIIVYVIKIKEVLMLEDKKKKHLIILKCSVVSLLAFGIPYYLSYLPIIIKYPYHKYPSALIYDFILLQNHIWKYHSTLVATHPFSSEWYQWILSSKPLWAYFENTLPFNLRSTIVYIGNPLIWGLGFVSVIYLFIIKVKERLRSINVLIIVSCYFFSIIPWILISRIKFIYHYYLALPWLYLSIILAIQSFKVKNEFKVKLVFGASVLSLVTYILYYPALTGLTVSTKWIDILKVFRSWIF